MWSLLSAFQVSIDSSCGSTSACLRVRSANGNDDAINILEEFQEQLAAAAKGSAAERVTAGKYIDGTIGFLVQPALAQQAQALRDFNRQAADPDVPTPLGVPATYGEHVGLMFDMLLLAVQTDSTRVATLLLAHDGSNRSFSDIGVSGGKEEILDIHVLGADNERDGGCAVHQEARALVSNAKSDDADTGYVGGDAASSGNRLGMVRRDHDDVALIRRAAADGVIERGKRAVARALVAVRTGLLARQ